jgi:hypothetical protein
VTSPEGRVDVEGVGLGKTTDLRDERERLS